MSKKRTKIADDLRDVQSAIKEIIGSDEITVSIMKTKNRINTKEYIILFNHPNEKLRDYLSEHAYYLYGHLCHICQTDNILPFTVENISKSWKYSLQNTYKTLHYLTFLNIILKRKNIKGEKYFFLNPQLGWRGSLFYWKNSILNLSVNDYVKINIDTIRSINRFKASRQATVKAIQSAVPQS